MWRAEVRAACFAAVLAATLTPVAAWAQEFAPGAAGATFYTGPNFSGSSKTLTLSANQPYQAIPFIGDELNEKVASLKVDPQLGVIFFQRPYFASRDDVCGPNLGTRENPRAWWLGLTADLEPPYALPPDQPYETSEMQDDDYSSVIAYRRELGPPPGFLLLERRSYYNRACERTDEQNYFNRIFVPVPNPPKREACTDLTLPANSYGAGADAPRFVRVTEALALLPESFDPRFAGIDHRFIATIFSGPGCSGASITLTSQKSGLPGRYKLKDFEFDRKAKSVLIRYQRGPLDPYMEGAPVAAAPAEPTTAAGTTAATTASGGSFASQPASSAAAAPSQALQPQAPIPPSPAPQSTGGLQPAPPSAPPPQQQALQPIPAPQATPAAPAIPRGPSTPQEETFRFPVHQVYRLNFCVNGDQGCGDPAANAFCKDKGFSKAARWSREDNIGALYPTVFIGSGTICDKFLCDGFEEITCSR